jgi:hypothetical protein
MCRVGRRARILLHLYIQLEGGVLGGSRATRRCVCFFVLCNRHWFNKAPGPDPRGPRWGLPIYPPPLAQTLAMPIYPYPYWEPQSASGLW